MSFCRELLFFQSCGSLSFSGQLDSTIFLQRFGELSTSLSSPLKSSTVEIVYIKVKGIIITLFCSEMGCSDKNVTHSGISGVALYLNGPPRMWREKRHGTNFQSFHWEVQKVVKLLGINQALTEQNL